MTKLIGRDLDDAASAVAARQVDRIIAAIADRFERDFGRHADRISPIGIKTDRPAAALAAVDRRIGIEIDDRAFAAIAVGRCEQRRLEIERAAGENPGRCDEDIAALADTARAALARAFAAIASIAVGLEIGPPVTVSDDVPSREMTVIVPPVPLPL